MRDHGEVREADYGWDHGLRIFWVMLGSMACCGYVHRRDVEPAMLEEGRMLACKSDTGGVERGFVFWREEKKGDMFESY